MKKEELEILKMKKYITPNEVFLLYGFSRDNQARLRMERKIPYHKMGRYVRYNRDELDNWIKNNKVEMVS
jgi:excisionase family DNA binding protein